jgi:CheY-like chemotaxis protein
VTGAPSEKPRVLVVEDDARSQELLAAALGTHYELTIARDGDDGLAMAAALDWSADVVIVDLQLGRGTMRGDQFVEQYRHRAKRRVPVVVVSGSDQAYELGGRLRAAATLKKPIEVAELRRVLEVLAPSDRGPRTV